jgi:protein-tyrosine phosphatase
MEVAEVLSLQANTNSVLARVGLDQQIEDVSLDHLGFVDHTVVKVQEIDALVMLTEDLLQKAWA